MAAHVRRINSQDKIATGILTAIVGLVLLILAAIVIYILIAGAGKLFDVSFLTSKPQQFKAGGGIGPELFNSFYLLFLIPPGHIPLQVTETAKKFWIVLNFPLMIFPWIFIHVFLQISKPLIDFLNSFRFKQAI